MKWISLPYAPVSPQLPPKKFINNWQTQKCSGILSMKIEVLTKTSHAAFIFNSEIFGLVNSLVMLNRIIIILKWLAGYLDFRSFHCLRVSWFSTRLSPTILYLCLISILPHKMVSIIHAFGVGIPFVTAAYNCKSKKSTCILKMLLFTKLHIEESLFPHMDHVQLNRTLQIVCDYVSFFLTDCDYLFPQ